MPNTPDFHIRLFLLAPVALLAGLLTASCDRPVTSEEALDDEAMQRFRKEERARTDGKARSPQEAAREWFYPKEIDNYFKGMDGIVAPATSATTIPVYQLLDTLTLPKDAGTGRERLPDVSIADPLNSYNEILGRNAWMIWCAGNEGFWDWLSTEFGFIDLLKLVDSRKRPTRFAEAGLINEPNMAAASGALPDEFGLYLDQPTNPAEREWRQQYIKSVLGDPPARPQTEPRSQGLYTNQSIAQAGQYDSSSPYRLDIPPPEIYGLSSGVVGLRLFPNPKFDAAARRKWDAGKYYADDRGDPTMIRPYRVGMSCAFCHASYHPLRPPIDLVNPKWENISGNIGAQYLRPRAVFANLLPKDNFVYHILDSQPPGTIDTSLIASDSINNPNAMNSVFNLAQRAAVSLRNPREKQSGPSRALPSLWRHPEPSPPPGADDATPAAWRNLFALEGLTDELHKTNDDPRRVPRILFDGADSIGAWGALARVYLNIGTNYEQWITLHNTVVGMRPQRSFTVAGVEKHSIYWYATELRVPALRDYFLRVTPPMPLLAADGGESRFYRSSAPEAQTISEAGRFRRVDLEKLKAGRRVFARQCIVCHSSVQPDERVADMQTVEQTGELWDHDPGRWLNKPSYAKWAEEQVETPQFWQRNYLSTDYRIPVNVVQTNACRAMATNAINGNMWEDFSSTTYRNMPSVGFIPFFNPFLGERGGDDRFEPRHAARNGAPARGGGPGFYRVPTLVSIWTTAPFLHNNSLGVFTNDPSLDGRLTAFDDAIRKLLWPERRLESSSFNDATPARLREDHGLIWRTPVDSYLTLPAAYLPQVLGSQSALFAMVKTRLPFLSGIPENRRPLPSALLLLVGFAALALAPNFAWRAVGYGFIGLAIVVGLLVYLVNGALLDLRLGPIPKGTPVNLLANVNPDAGPAQLRQVLATARDTLAELESTQPDEAGKAALFRQRLAPALMNVNKCPDLVMDRGHYFEWFKGMSADDKNALIELLKTF